MDRQKEECKCIKGYIEDNRENVVLVTNPMHWNPKYYTPFKFCPNCGKDLTIKFCGSCLNLTPTEEEQDSMQIFARPKHWCRRLKKHIKHGFYHPNLPRLEGCDDYKPREGK